MPHLLMAGTTGSGKSVSVNTMLMSFLYKHTPDELRLLLIDPKMIEFQPYNHIPHLLLPVVTDMSLACLALKWAVDEMERRYQLFADVGSRNLESYNAKVDKLIEKAKNREKEAEKEEPLTAITSEGNVVEFGSGQKEEEKLPERLPLIVICIDELADLMMVAAKDVEISIARLAQKARAAGLHLIVATQRPSTDVVTGLIKANFPARLSCQVSSGIDSRTILGSNGAENLLGNGDMLIVPPGTSDLKRVQGAFVSEEEIAEIVEFLKQQGTPEYDEEILKDRDLDDSGAVDEEEKDEVYDQAVAIVAELQSCSISMLQRKLRIGYNRSARIVEIMEKEGVVGPANGVNKREVLISPQ
jgi:S-DNA-T family DNA segregation ATPase FtsK/SpoIIIE